MRGRPGCPTEQEKNSVEATGGSPLFYFYKERLGTGSPPHPPQCAHWGTFPPRGRLWAWALPFPTTTPTPPSPPSWGAGRSLRRMQGRRPGYKKSGIPRRISQTRVGRPEGRNSPLWCSFLHFSQEKWRPPAGTPPGRCAPRPLRRHGPKGPLPTGARPPAPRGRV